MKYKDWTGNKNSVFKTLGASNHTDKERPRDDYYATDPMAIDALLKDGSVKLSEEVWECAAGSGCLSKRLKHYGYSVLSTDLVDRGYGTGGVDFLACTEMFDGDIITNPPYNCAQEFIQHALELIPSGRRVFMFLKIQFLEGKKRRELFDSGCLKTVYVSSSRILCAKNGDFENARKIGGSAVSYAWYEFEKGYKGGTTIKWIN